MLDEAWLDGKQSIRCTVQELEMIVVEQEPSFLSRAAETGAAALASRRQRQGQAP